MHSVLREIIAIRDDDGDDDDNNDRLMDIAAAATRQNIIPTNKKLWSHLLHSVDKRLNNAPTPTTMGDDSKTTTSSSSSSSSAIYQMLRHGPVLFHDFEDER